MTETTVGREPVQIVEIVQPLCANTYGSAPCTASGTADEKCYNTRATCQDTANYDGSSTLSLFFAAGHVAERGVSGAPYIIPSLVSVSTSPTKINLSGINPDVKGLGNRALCTIKFKDHPHTDRRVDPYVSGRSWDPFARGSFWSKWIVRNKFWNLIRINVYEGYAGQALGAMNVRTYFMDNINGPDDGGNVTIQGKDVLARIEARKAQAPEISPGELFVDITSTQTSFEVAGAVTADYDSSGILRIGDELMRYTAVASSANGIEFTGVTRGVERTTADSHSAEDEVQLCVEYNEEFPEVVLEDLLNVRAGIPSAFLDTTNWENERVEYAQLVKLTTIISEPTSVSDLVSEILIQIGAYLWWDERDQLVKFSVIKGVTEDPPLITAEDNILQGFMIERMPRQRVSQVWFYYGIRDYTGELTKPSNYFFGTVVADLASETDEQYGEPSIQKIFSRWLRTAVGSNATASKISTRYRDVPRRAMFEVDAKDRSYWTGDQIRISHYLDVDEFGERQISRWTIISAEEVLPGEKVKYVAEDTTLYGVTFVIQTTGAADYNGTPSSIGFNAYIGNSSGLLSDGTEAARIG